MKRFKMLLLLCIGLCFLSISLALLNICPVCYKHHVVHNYFDAIGINSDKGIEYDTVIQNTGEPTRKLVREYNDNPKYREIILDYELFALYYLSSSSNLIDDPPRFLRLEVYSPQIVFRRNIHVGSTRREIEFAFRGFQKTYEYGELGYFDCKTWSIVDGHVSPTRVVAFEFDENDIVSSICFQYPG